MKVLAFGEILWDVYPDRKYLGGAPLNFAAHLAKHAEEAYMLSSVGEDELGKEAVERILQWGVCADYITYNTCKQTGKCLVTLDERSVPSYQLLEDVAYDHIPCSEINDDFDVLYFGTLALRSAENRKALIEILQNHCFKEIFVDINIRPPFYSDETVTFAIEQATILKISEEELPAVYEAMKIPDATDYREFTRLLARKCERLSCVIVTLGEKGAYVLDCRYQKAYDCGSPAVQVQSTVGAGDSFSAAFLSKFMRGCDIPTCLSHAVKVAAFVVSEFDAVPDYTIYE